MKNRFLEFAWFLLGSAGVLVIGTVAVAIPTSRLLMCSEFNTDDPPTCLPGAVPDIWLQTYQALLVAFVLWIVASAVLPVLLSFVTSRPKYRSLQNLWLIFACFAGLCVGTSWAEQQYPESYWESNDAVTPMMLGVFWTFFVTGSIIDAMNKKITPQGRVRPSPVDVKGTSIWSSRIPE